VWDRIVGDLFFIGKVKWQYTWMLTGVICAYILPYLFIALFVCRNKVYGRPRRAVNYLNILFKLKHMYIDHFD
jgi:hypothetical protein